MINVKGYRLLVKPDDIETKSAGGIIMVQDEKLEANGQQFGTVVGIGEDCWTDKEGNQLKGWCVVGDRILYAKFAGRFVYDPETKEEYMIMNDVDVLATIK